MATYLKIAGLNGDVALKNYKGCIRVLDLNWDFSSMNNSSQGTLMGFNVSEQNYNTFKVIQYSDHGLTDILRLTKPNSKIDNIEGWQTNTDDDNALVAENYIWKNCRIHSVSQNKSYSNNATLAFYVSYTWFQLTTKSYNSNGKFKSQKAATYDVETGAWV